MLVTEEAEAASVLKVSASPKHVTARKPSGSDGDFVRRHVGPGTQETREMLDVLGFSSLEALVDVAIPAAIRLTRPLELPPARAEHEVLTVLEQIAGQNQVFRSYIGMGYYDCITPAVL